MKCRYKKTGAEFDSSRFNTYGLGEVLTGDDSASISSLDVFVNGEWKDMRQAFIDDDIIPNNLNTDFGVPINAEAKVRSYNP